MNIYTNFDKKSNLNDKKSILTNADKKEFDGKYDVKPKEISQEQINLIKKDRSLETSSYEEYSENKTTNKISARVNNTTKPNNMKVSEFKDNSLPNDLKERNDGEWESF